MPTLGVIIAAYLLGSVSFAVVVSKMFGLPDPHSYGSGNPGATNYSHRQQGAAARPCAAMASRALSRCGPPIAWARAGAMPRSRPRAPRLPFTSVTCIRCSIISPAGRACRRRQASRSRCRGSSVSRCSSSGCSLRWRFACHRASLVAALARRRWAFISSVLARILGPDVDSRCWRSGAIAPTYAS